MRLDELTRSGPTPTPLTPVCRVKLNVDVPLAASTDVFAQNNWVVGQNPAGASEDPDGIATLSTASGTYSYITIAVSGRYLVSARGVFTNPASGGSCAAYVTRGATSINNSIARDARNTTNAGGDGTICHASRSVYLSQGDVLYWGHWSSVGSTLSHVTFNVPTEVSLAWLGTR